MQASSQQAVSTKGFNPGERKKEMTTQLNDVPHQMWGWMNSLPQDNVGTFYAKIRPPGLPIGKWFKVPVWGQVCDGQDHRSSVENFLHNEFPLRGKGWTYVEWRTEPDNPDLCKHPTSGKVENPRPFSGA